MDLIVTDGSKAGASKVSFNVNLQPNLAFAAPQSIEIPPGLFPGSLPSAGEASPYPSVNAVSGVGGLVSGITVTLLGFTHRYPANLDLMLVKYDQASSKNIAVMLMSHAGGANPASNLRLSFSDSGAAGVVPQSGQLTSTTYQPFAWPGNEFTSVGPPFSGAFTTTLSSFDGIDPNGNWMLYVLDDTYTASGVIAGGWIITFQTSPAFAFLDSVTTAENTPLKIPLLLGDSSSGNNDSNLVVTVTTANLNSPSSPFSLANLINPTNLVVTEITGSNRTLTVTPTQNYPSAVSTNNGTNSITIDVSDGTYTYGQTIQFVVQNLNQPPVITPSSNVVNVLENGGTTNIIFTVTDADSMLSTTDNFNVVSSIASIVPNSSAGIAYVSGGFSPIAGTLGSSGIFTFALTPAVNAFGTDTITISINDDHNNFTSTNITLNVIHTAQLPVISNSAVTNGPIPTQSVLVGTVSPPIPFYVSTVESDVSSKQLLVTAAASGFPTILPPSSITLAQVNGGVWTIQFAPLGTLTAGVSIPITLTVVDPINNRTNSVTFDLNVEPSLVVQVFANTAPIAAYGFGTNSPATNGYPSLISVSGLSNEVYNVQVILTGFTDNDPADADVLLVAPNGTTSVILMSGMGGGGAANGLRLAFQDSGPVLPFGGVFTSGTNQPADYNNGANGQPKDVLPPTSPGSTSPPGRPYNTALASLKGLNPNGNWSLYVSDHQSGDLVQVTGGWSLVLKTTPNLIITGPPSLLSSGVVTLNENNLTPSGQNTSVTNINFTIEDISTYASNLTVSAVSDNPRILAASSFSFSPSPISATNMVLTIAPVPDISGSCNLKLTVTRGDGASTTVTIPVVVTTITVPVSLTRLLNITEPENTVSKLDFIVSTFDTPLPRIGLSVTSDNPAVLTTTSNPSGILLPSGTNSMVGLAANVAPSASDVTLQLTPVLNAIGTATVTVTVTNPGPAGNVLTVSTFTFTTTPIVGPPQFGAIAAQSVSGGSTINVPFTVISLNTPTPNVTVTAISSDTTKVANPIITPATASGAAPGTRSLNLTAMHGATGKVTIVLTATDGTNTNVVSFTVIIRPSRDYIFANTPAVANGVLTNGIDINDYSPGSPYPSSATVSRSPGPNREVERERVRLRT